METEQKKVKKKLSTPKKILVGFLSALVLLIVGFGVFTLVKLYGMSMNAARFVAKPTVSPYATPDPGLQEANDNLDLTRDWDSELDPNLIYLDPIYVENAIDPDVVNILVIGEDDSLDAVSGRSDVTLIVSYNQRLHTVKTISVLRDTWVYISGRDRWNRINAAYRFGGVGLAINTINENFGLDIQYYMKTDFNNLVSIIDKLGGLDVPLSEEELAYYAKTHPNNTITDGENGVYHLNGEQVLAHVRNRTIGNGDWSRTERQRIVMNSLLKRARQEKDIVSLTSLIYSLTDYIDTNLSPWQMISIGSGVVFGSNLNNTQKGTIPCTGSWNYAYEGSMAVIHIDLEKNRQWIRGFIYGVQ
ncbi:MAG: LCP family protein [Clostridia bacterium]|nr:LCP family protein [Clostridia bacterium]